MDLDTFLTIYKLPISKLKLNKVKLVRQDENKQGKVYYHFLGEFECKPHRKVLDSLLSKEDKDLIIKELGELIDEPTFMYRKKYTRKVQSKTRSGRWTFDYFFDISPVNIVDFELNKQEEKMILIVRGYGIF